MLDESQKEKLLAVDEKLRPTLKPSRYVHSVAVAHCAAALAMRYDLDLYQAFLAGLLHDCAKACTEEELLHICREAGEELREIELQSPDLLHANAGAILAKNQYGITDEEILSAIRLHTTGAPQMSPLSEIIFIADFIEPGRNQCSRLPEIRPLAFEDKERCVLEILKEIQKYLKYLGVTSDERALEAQRYYETLLQERKA